MYTYDDYPVFFFSSLEIDNWWDWGLRSPASLSVWVAELNEPLPSPRNVVDLVYDFPSSPRNVVDLVYDFPSKGG